MSLLGIPGNPPEYGPDQLRFFELFFASIGAMTWGAGGCGPSRQQTAIVTGAFKTTNQGTATMRKLMLSTAAVAVLFSGAAFAATGHSETGVIAKIDAKAHSITLKSGKIKTFELGTGVDASGLKVGEKVVITYDLVNKKPVASEVTAAPAPAKKS